MRCRLHVPALPSYALAALVGFVAQPSLAQTLDPDLWMTNGVVYALARDGNTLYVGGEFTYVGPRTGSAAIFDGATGDRIPTPIPVGEVYVAASDGADGWFIGGPFREIGNLPREGLAHVDANGNVTAWDPGTEGGPVRAMVVRDGIVWIAGNFTVAGGEERLGVAAIDAVTGTATSWNPDIEYPEDEDFGDLVVSMQALAVTESTVYLSGNLVGGSGQPRRHAAAFDRSTGQVTPWSPDPNRPFDALAVRDSMVYAGGDFDSVANAPRARLAAVHARTGAALDWNPGASARVLAIVLGESVAYIGGHFTSAGGANRGRLAAIDLDTGFATGWNPNANEFVHVLALENDVLYAGGGFTTMGAVPRNHLAALDPGSGLPTAWSASTNGVVYAIRSNGTRLFVGGNFVMSGGAPRASLAAVDVTTGRLTSWAPAATGGSGYRPRVRSLAVEGTLVYVGGDFTGLAGVGRKNLGAIDRVTGVPNGFNPAPAGFPYAIVPQGSVVYVGGGFNEIGGKSRNAIAALNASTGTAISWSSALEPGAVVHDLELADGVLYVGGEFQRLLGPPRRNLAAVSLMFGSPTTWNPAPPQGPVYALETADSVLFVGGWFDSIAGVRRPNLAMLSRATGQALEWGPEVNGSVSSLDVGDGIVYFTGGFTGVGTLSRPQVAAIHRASGVPTPYQAVLDRDFTFHEYSSTHWSPRPIAIEAEDGDVHLGGVFTHVAGQPHYFLAGWTDVSTPALVERFTAHALPQGILLRWSFAAPERVSSVRVERADAVDGAWLPIATSAHERWNGFELLDPTAEPGIELHYRLVVELADGLRATSSPVSAVRPASGPMAATLRAGPSPAFDASPTTIAFRLPSPGHARVRILDIQGRAVRTLLDQARAAGAHEVSWDGRTESGVAAPGVYRVTLEWSNERASRTIVRLR